VTSPPTSTETSPTTRGRRQIVTRLLCLGAAVAWVGVLAVVFSTVTQSSTEVISSNDGHGIVTRVVSSSPTLVAEDGSAVLVILLLLLLLCAVAAASLLYRHRRGIDGIGIAGIIAAGLAGLLTLLGALSIGLFVAPLAMLLTVVALPLESRRT